MASLGNNLAAAMAFNRFGLGGRPDDAIPSSPAAWLIGQLSAPDPYNGGGLPDTPTALAFFASIRAANLTGPTQNYQIVQLLNTEIDSVMQNALTTKMPFRERLVWFWANHFALMAQELEVAVCAGAFIREAIRPHVTGTFKDMLLAVMQHPAMLVNLNNDCSAGPNSVAAQRCQITGCASSGINENLARECLELHTLGVNGGYTQADVDALAMLISGWTVNIKTQPMGFVFNAQMHEPTAQTLMGVSYPPTQAGGIAALTWLATQPATYRHLATQLVTHFVSDTPAAADIASVAAALASTGGNLAAAATVVVNLPSAWQPYAKLRTPVEYVMAAMRAVGLNASVPGVAGCARLSAAALGEAIWQPPFPNGYSDLAADWTGPAQMLLRADYINAFASAAGSPDPVALAASSLGPLLRPSTVTAMNAAVTIHDKLSLLFLSPEFQRR